LELMKKQFQTNLYETQVGRWFFLK
jgi:hypothetical protein